MKKYILIEKSNPGTTLGESDDREALQREADSYNQFPEPGKKYVVVNRRVVIAVRVFFIALVIVLFFLTCN